MRYRHQLIQASKLTRHCGQVVFGFSCFETIDHVQVPG
jgi:hypothetical protein